MPNSLYTYDASAPKPCLNPESSSDEAMLLYKYQLLYDTYYQIYMICKHILLITFLNKPEFIFSRQLNDLKYCYLTLIILFNITHSFTHS